MKKKVIIIMVIAICVSFFFCKRSDENYTFDVNHELRENIDFINNKISFIPGYLDQIDTETSLVYTKFFPLSESKDYTDLINKVDNSKKNYFSNFLKLDDYTTFYNEFDITNIMYLDELIIFLEHNKLVDTSAFFTTLETKDLSIIDLPLLLRYQYIFQLCQKSYQSLNDIIHRKKNIEKFQLDFISIAYCYKYIDNAEELFKYYISRESFENMNIIDVFFALDSISKSYIINFLEKFKDNSTTYFYNMNILNMLTKAPTKIESSTLYYQESQVITTNKNIYMLSFLVTNLTKGKLNSQFVNQMKNNSKKDTTILDRYYLKKVFPSEEFNSSNNVINNIEDYLAYIKIYAADNYAEQSKKRICEDIESPKKKILCTLVDEYKIEEYNDYYNYDMEMLYYVFLLDNKLKKDTKTIQQIIDQKFKRSNGYAMRVNENFFDLKASYYAIKIKMNSKETL